MTSWKRILLPISGFISTAILFSVLASVTFYSPLILSQLNSSLSLSSFISIITIIYFAGMPFGKIVGRIIKFHENASFWTAVMIIIIIITIFFMPYVHNFYLFLLLRFIQGSSSFLMEIFSISYSFIYKERERSLASALSISGIPAGVTLGSLVALNFNYHEAFILIPVIGIILMIPFVYLLYVETLEFRNNRKYNKSEKASYTTLKFRFTWIYGFLWMTIAGFNLTLAVVIPLYLKIYSPSITGTAMAIFGYWGAIATVIGGAIAYLVYYKLKGTLSLITVAVLGYALSIPGFILMYLHYNSELILIGIFLIMMEGLVISPIYTTPVDVYGREKVGNGVWEFSLIGSSGHIIAPLTLLPLGMIVGFNVIFLILIIFPIYGIIGMFLIYTYIRDNHIRKV